MQQEIWRDILGYEGLYQVSNKGRIFSLPKGYHNGIIKKQVYSIARNKMRIQLHKSGQREQFSVRCLVADMFIPNPKEYKLTRNINGDVRNNKSTNIEWFKHNGNDYFTIGHKLNIGEDNPNVKLTNKKVREIKKEFKKKTINQIKDMYNISSRTVYNIVKGRSWKHI